MDPRKSQISRMVVHAILIIACFLVLFPTFWMVSTSLTSSKQIFSDTIRLFPSRPTLENYWVAIDKYPVWIWFTNSMFISVVMVGGQLITGLLAAYGLACFDFPGKQFFFWIVVGTLMVPNQVTMIPNYITMSKLGWLNTSWAVIVPFLASGFAVFFLRQHVKTIPVELYEAATIDGAKSFAILVRVVAPLSKAPLTALAILQFITSWNMYFWPLLVLSKPSTQTIAIGLRQFLDGEFGFIWGELTAAATLASIPTVLLYIFAQKHIMNMSITSGLK